MGRTVKMQLRGAASDGEHVRLGEFLVQLRALQLALIRTEQMISDEDRPSTYYRITDLSHSSPATVVLEAAPYRRERPVDVGEQVIKKFFVGLKQISEIGLVSEDYDRTTLEIYQKLSQTLQRNITEIKLSTPGYQISITPEFAARIEHLLGSDVVREGAIDGMLEAIYLHNKVNKFYIFPSVGPAKVTCHFPEEMMRKAIGAINRYVRVAGQMKVKERGFFPHEIEVAEMTVHPRSEEVPTLSSLRGLAPNATGKTDSVTFVRSMRNVQRKA